MDWKRIGIGLSALIIAPVLLAAPLKPAVSIDISAPTKATGPVTVKLEVQAKVAIRTLSLRAYMDKVPLAIPAAGATMMQRGERQSVDIFTTLPDRKEHWFFVEAEVTLPTGERMTVGKSLRLNPAKGGAGSRQDSPTFETLRSGKPDSQK